MVSSPSPHNNPIRRFLTPKPRVGFSLVEFRKSRRRNRLAGKVLFWGSLAMLILDMATPWPTPVQGQYAVWWLLVTALGAGLWLTAKRLPLEETLEIAKYSHGELKVPDLTSELHVTIETAERILDALARKGYARVEDRGEVRVWVFPDIKSPTPPQPPTPTNPSHNNCN